MTGGGFSEPLQQIDRVFVRSGGRKLLYFGGCDYFRLSSHPRVLEAVRRGLGEFGLSTSASRKTTGNHRVYDELEECTARFFFGAPRAVLLSSGYVANVAFAQALAGQTDAVLVDERSHDSLKDSARASGCRVIEFRHRDAADLGQRLAKIEDRSKTVILTDGMFAFDGSVAPLRAYREVAGARPLLWVDDAHSAGVLGANGRGSLEHAGIRRENVVQTITFSKAFGVYGGAVLCSDRWRAALLTRSSAVAGNTPLPLPLAAAAKRALGLATAQRREKLFRNVEVFWDSFGSEPPLDLSPIIGLQCSRTTASTLEAAGIYPSLIRYPGGPARGYLRLALSSEHTPEQVRRLATVLRAARTKRLVSS